VIAVAIDDRVDFAGSHRPDEHGALRAERYLARVLDILGEDVDLKSRRDNPTR